VPRLVNETCISYCMLKLINWLIDWLVFNGTSTQKGQFVPTAGAGNRHSRSAKDGQRDTMHITLKCENKRSNSETEDLRNNTVRTCLKPISWFEFGGTIWISLNSQNANYAWCAAQPSSLAYFVIYISTVEFTQSIRSMMTRAIP